MPDETAMEFCCRVSGGTYHGSFAVSGETRYFAEAQFDKKVIRATAKTQSGAWSKLAESIRSAYRLGQVTWL